MFRSCRYERRRPTRQLGLSRFGTNFRPQLCPAIICCVQELERILLHFFVFIQQFSRYGRGSTGHPLFIALGSFSDVHKRLLTSYLNILVKLQDLLYCAMCIWVMLLEGATSP